MRCVTLRGRTVPAVAGLAGLAGLAILAILAPAARSAENAAKPEKVTTVEGITEYRLDNGLRVLLFPDPSTPKVTVNLTVLTGSRHEGYGETGMAHLLEHMVFKGTPTFKDVPKALRDHGASFNGSTWVDRTNYFETLNGTDENLEFALKLEADRLVNSFVKREDLASEMTVVRNEFEQGENSPTNVLSQRMMATAYEWHNYGKSTIGNRSDIERVPIENLQAFYRKHYQPDNCMLVVAGKFDPDKALAFIGQYFGPLKRPERKLDDTYTEEPPQDGERVVVLRRVGSVGAVGAIYHIPAGSHEDFAAVEVLANLLSSQPSGRLYQALVTTKKATSVSVSAEGYHDPGVLEVLAQVDRNNPLDGVRDTMTELLEKLPSEKFSDEEVERARRRLLKNRRLLMNEANRIGIVLSEWGAKGDWRLFFLHRDRLAKVTPADVQRVAARYLKTSNRTVGLYYPTEQPPPRAEVPATPAVPDLVKEYKGGKATVLGESIDPAPQSIEQRVRRSELPAGIKVALLPKKTRGEAVVFDLTLRYGSAESLKGQTAAAQLLGTLMARGTKKHTRLQLEDELDALDCRLGPSSNLGEVGFSFECPRESLPGVLKLLGEILREPSFPQEEFDVLKRQRRELLERSLKEPQALAGLALQRKLMPYPKDDVRYVPTLEESIARIEAVTLEQVKKLYADQLGAAAGELVAVGDFDADALPKQVQDLLKDWKPGVAYERIARPAKTDIAGEKIVIDTPDKKNAVYIAGLMLGLKDTDPDNAALEVGNFLFGGGSLSSRLGNRVRQKEGLSYGVASQYNADARDPSARFMMFAICNPANMEKVDKAIAEELDKLLQEGVTAKELDEAKKAYLAAQKVARSGDSQLAAVISSELADGRTLAYYADLEKQVSALTPEAVNAALKKHLTPGRLTIIHAGDFKPKGGTPQ